MMKKLFNFIKFLLKDVEISEAIAKIGILSILSGVFLGLAWEWRPNIHTQYSLGLVVFGVGLILFLTIYHAIVEVLITKWREYNREIEAQKEALVTALSKEY